MDDTPRIFIGATTFHITGMGSHECARAVLVEVGAVHGVLQVTADILSSTITVRASEPVDKADIARAVRTVGHAVTP